MVREFHKTEGRPVCTRLQSKSQHTCTFRWTQLFARGKGRAPQKIIQPPWRAAKGLLLCVCVCLIIRLFWNLLEVLWTKVPLPLPLLLHTAVSLYQILFGCYFVQSVGTSNCLCYCTSAVRLTRFNGRPSQTAQKAAELFSFRDHGSDKKNPVWSPLTRSYQILDKGAQRQSPPP